MIELSFNKIGNGAPLLILHGLYGSGDNWHGIAKSLSDKFTIYLIDQRNHGNSPHTASHTYEEMTSDLKFLVDKERLQNINIIGHSMGGKTAMSFTLQHGDLVNKLICVDISPYSYEGIPRFQEQYSFHSDIVERFINAPIGTARSRNEIEEFFSIKISNSNIRRFLLKNLKRHKGGRFSWKLNASTIAKSLMNIIYAAPPVKLGAQTYVNSLFIRGGKSPYISDEDIVGIKDIFLNSHFITYNNSGHWLHAEETERFIADIKGFLIN